ncbi:hypothetical protein Tco_0621927, partial [Tanacetum coccineum]
MYEHFSQDKHIEVSGISKEVGTQRYLSLVVPLKKVGDEAIYKELGDKMERAVTTTFSLEVEQNNGSVPSTTEDGVHAITATIDGRDKIITEASIRRHLKLQDSKGLSSLPNEESFAQLARMG